MNRQSWLVGLLALSLLSGCGGEAESPASETMNETQQAKVFAQTLQNIETPRQALYQSLENTVDFKVLEAVRCNNPDTLKGLSRQVRRDIIDYCETAETLVREANLTVSQFNEMMQRMEPDSGPENEEFQELVRDAWATLQGQV